MFNKREYDREYAKQHFEQLRMDVKKGQKQIIQEQAKKRGYKSTKEYIIALIEKDMRS